MKPAFYQNARGEFVLAFGLFKTLDPDALAAGKLKIKPEFRRGRRQRHRPQRPGRDAWRQGPVRRRPVRRARQAAEVLASSPRN
jgi:hypothetical protein